MLVPSTNTRARCTYLLTYLLRLLRRARLVQLLAQLLLRRLPRERRGASRVGARAAWVSMRCAGTCNTHGRMHAGVQGVQGVQGAQGVQGVQGVQTCSRAISLLANSSWRRSECASAAWLGGGVAW